MPETAPPNGTLLLARRALRRVWRTVAGPGRAEVRTVEYRGARFEVLANEDVGWRLLVAREYESAELDALERHTRPTDVCVDVGAHVGIFTVLMARRVPRGRVVAFEPMREHRELLERNVRANRLANVEVRDSVAAERAGDVDFSVSVDGAFSSMKPTGRRRESERRRVRAETLDDAMRPSGQRIDVLKIDVEGAELLVLRGAQSILADATRRPRAMLIELSARNQAAYGYEPAAIVRLLAAHGYEAHALLPDGSQKPWPAPGASESVLFLPAKGEQSI